MQTSAFRAGFHLKEKDKGYVREKGMDTIRRHAQDFVRERLAPAVIPNDRKQTPIHGHPAFLHSTPAPAIAVDASANGIEYPKALN